MSYGFESTRKVNDSLIMERLETGVPSIVWGQIIGPEEQLFVSLPELKGLRNARVMSVPLDYSYSRGRPGGFSVGNGNTNTYIDFSRYYMVPQPHKAAFYSASGRIAVTKAMSDVKELEQLYHDFGILVEDGTLLDIDHVIAMGRNPQEFFKTGGYVTNPDGTYAASNLNINYARLLQEGNISVVLSLGVRPVVESSADGFERWLFYMLANVDSSDGGATRNGDYSFAEIPMSGVNEILIGIIKAYQDANDPTVIRPTKLVQGQGTSYDVYPQFSTSFTFFNFFGGAQTVNRSSWLLPKKLWELNLQTGRIFLFSYYPTRIQLGDGSVVDVTLDNYLSLESAKTVWGYFIYDLSRAYTDIGAVPVKYGTYYADFNTVYTVPLKLGGVSYSFSGRKLAEAIHSPELSWNFGENGGSPFDRMEVKRTRCRSYVFIVADVTRDEILQKGLDVGTYGFVDGNATINQHYSNMFLYEDIEISKPNLSGALSSLSMPTYGSRHKVIWDDPYSESTAHEVLLDTVEIPLSCYIPATDPALVVVHEKSAVDWAFLGFKRDASRYTHACFYVPKWVGNLRFSVLSMAPQNPGEYKKVGKSFTCTHGKMTGGTGSSKGTISYNDPSLVTIKYSGTGYYFAQQGKQYGVMVRNKAGRVVYNSTAYPQEYTSLSRLDGADLYLLGGGSIGRSSRMLRSAKFNRPVSADLAAGVVGGTFNSLDFASHNVSWDKSKSDLFTKTTWYTDIMMVTSATPVCCMTGGYARIAYAPTWSWYIKYGDKTSSLTALGSIIGFVVAVVAAYFGYYQLALSLATTQMQINALYAMMPGYQAPGLSSFMFVEGEPNMYVMHIKDLQKADDK
jgi:hypothetical protein